MLERVCGGKDASDMQQVRVSVSWVEEGVGFVFCERVCQVQVAEGKAATADRE